MANLKISQLPTASVLVEEDFIPVVNSAAVETQQATLSQVLTYITSSTFDSLAVTTITSSVSNIGIGNAEDGDYTDGLFVTFSPTTKLGTVVDKFNEVLKGLSPPPAPDLTNLERNVTTGTEMKMSFDDSTPAAGYTEVVALDGTLIDVNKGQTFALISGPGGNRIRMGVFSSLTSLTLVLNNDTAQNGSPPLSENYPADAFNVSPDGIGTFTLEVNGIDVTPVGTTSNTASYNANNFNLSEADTAYFPATGLSFELFRNRTGTVVIPTSNWIFGHNYAKVTHISSLGTHVTNYVDWVYDPAAANSGPAYGFTTTSSSFSATGTKYLSGIVYYTAVSYNFSSSITNFYKNVYSANANGGITFGSISSGLSTTAFTSTPVPINTDSVLQRSSAHNVTGNIRLLGQTLTSTLNVANGLGKTGSSVLTTPTILLDRVNTANTNTEENFCLENYRVGSGSYDTQVSLTSATFISSSALATSELAVYNGAARYPTQVLNGGNVAGSTVVYKQTGQPNYSGVTQNRYYFRKFVNGAGALASFNLLLRGANINFITSGGVLTGNNIKISIKVPGSTGWRDCLTAAPANTIGIELNDGVGCLGGSAPANLVAEGDRTIAINLLTEGILPDDSYVIRIEASSGWAGYVKKLQIS